MTREQVYKESLQKIIALKDIERSFVWEAERDIDKAVKLATNALLQSSLPCPQCQEIFAEITRLCHHRKEK